MPLRTGQDKEGCFYAWGGRKIHYPCGNEPRRREAKKEIIRFAFAVTPKEAKREFG